MLWTTSLLLWSKAVIMLQRFELSIMRLAKKKVTEQSLIACNQKAKWSFFTKKSSREASRASKEFTPKRILSFWSSRNSELKTLLTALRLSIKVKRNFQKTFLFT
jgi:hypothetical protein